MKENKTKAVAVRVTPTQEEALNKIVEGGTAKNYSQAIQYLINQYAILNSK